jgi:1-acyl-sn-glycerol-3-phosphate acyltransferase
MQQFDAIVVGAGIAGLGRSPGLTGKYRPPVAMPGMKGLYFAGDCYTGRGRLQDFKKGGFMLALQTGAVIIPVGIRGSETILPPDTYDFVLGRKIEVNIGEPIDASLYNLEQRDALMQNVRQAIEGLCGERE